MNYRPIIKIINTAIINEKALFQAPTFKKQTRNTFLLSLFIFLFFPLAYVRATREILWE